MGTFIRLDGVNPGAENPLVNTPDSLLPEQGALYLYEFGHPASGFPVGTPTNGQVVRNLARDQAAAMVGVTPSATDGLLNVGAVVPGSSLVERTSKGGIHSIRSQTQAVSGGVHIPTPAALLSYLAAHPAHAVYASVWMRITRPSSGTGSFSGASFADATSAYSLLYTISNDGNNYPSGSTRIGFSRVPSSAWNNASLPPGTPAFANIAVTGHAGAVGARREGKALSDGTGAPFAVSGSAAAAQGSFVIYRGYAEDLTVSGRTFGEVNTKDQELFTKHVSTEGGRYHGDTWTNPTTLP